jgi:hypothetical protein
MKALVKNNQIKLYDQLPSTWNGVNGYIINFKQSTEEVLEQNGFYNVVKPSYNPLTQTKGELYFDEANSIVTYDVTDINFDQNIDILDEEDNVIGTEKLYKIDHIKASKIFEIKSKAKELLQPTDWQVIRKVERNINIDTDVATERVNILNEADRLEAEVNSFTTYLEVLQYKIQFFS